ncbi:MAG: 1-deoxy-D-xylulose-5-phosphate reductoisomerase [Candidatus Xenobia bacterium]
MKKRLSILGSTGSIGTQTLDVVEAFPDRFEVVALTAGSRWEQVAEQARRFKVPFVAVRDEADAARLREALPGVTVRAGEAGVLEAAQVPCEMVVVALVGVAGMRPTMLALEAGRDVALANKEALVVAGPLMMAARRQPPQASPEGGTLMAQGRRIMPIDSEHSAIYQCLVGENPESVARIVLTCSGGPFRQTPREELAGVDVAGALAHPNWKMGSKITIDSATLMNKGFEVLEAHHLYQVPLEKIDVVVHAESIIHSMVEFVDGSVKAQLCPPDMRLPIMYALAYPERLPRSWKPTPFASMGPLTFEAPRRAEFPCLDLAYRAGRIGGSMPAVLNAANEVAVELFLSGRIGFVDIPALIEGCMEQATVLSAPTLADLLEVDRETRREARERAVSALRPHARAPRIIEV